MDETGFVSCFDDSFFHLSHYEHLALVTFSYDLSLERMCFILSFFFSLPQQKKNIRKKFLSLMPENGDEQNL